MIVSVGIILVVTMIFSISKGENTISEPLVKNVAAVESGTLKGEIGEQGEGGGFELWDNLSFNNRLLLLCYIMGLFVWYYSIYLNNLEPSSHDSAGKARVDSYMDDITSLTEDL